MHQWTNGRDLAPRYVWVYGTLRAGGSNDITRLEPAPQWVGAAPVRGRLYHLGAYPGLRLDDTAGGVCGEVYAITPALEAVLDRIEGVGQGGWGPDGRQDEYQRRSIAVQVQGVSLPCLVYEVHPLRVADAPLLDHGDWMRVIAGF